MARITVSGFSGVVRITAPQRLEDHQAQVATDCDFRSGDLRPYYGDKASTTYAGTFSAADPSSMFLYDQGALIVEPNDISFARSPVFFSDNLGNDKRVFYADNNDTGDYPKVIETVSGTGRIPASTNRLGVPKPNKIGEDAIDREDQQGTVDDFWTATNSDGYVLLPKAGVDGANLKKGDRLLLEAPGYALGAVQTIKSLQLLDTGGATEHYQVTLEGDRRKWKLGTLYLTKGETTIQFVLSGHGFQSDDLVFFSHNKNTAGSRSFPTTNLGGNEVNLARPFRVTNATYDRFELQYYDDGWTTLALTAAPSKSGTFESGGETIHKKVASLASYTMPFPDAGLPVVELKPDTGGSYYGTAYTLNGYAAANIEAQWYNAATADTVADRSYCVTFVNSFGDESEPSLPTDTMTVVPGSPVTFNAKSIPTAATGLDKYKEPKEIRLYRTDALGTFRLVTTDSMDPDTTKTNRINFLTAKAINLAGTGVIFTDTFLDSELGEPLATAGWSVPAIGMHGLVNCPNGVVAGHRGRTIFGSVPYAPYAWPILNQVATDYDVVGLVPTSAGLVVVTKGMPAILIGDNPANWTMQKLEYPQGCVARRSIVDMGEFAMYASPDGLVAITGANVEILTKPILTREQWQAYNPSTITAAQVEGRYIATYVKDGSRHGFIYDPQTQSFTDLTLTAVAFCNDLLADVLLMLDTDGKIYEWNQNTAAFKPYHWISKWFQLPIPELMGVAQIFTTTVNLTGKTLKMTLWGYDNNQIVKIYEISTTSSPDAILGNRPFRLPYVAPGRFSAFEVELEGSIPVGTVMVGRTMDEMKLAP